MIALIFLIAFGTSFAVALIRGGQRADDHARLTGRVWRA